MIHPTDEIGVSFNGRTADSGSANRGSNPCTPAGLSDRTAGGRSFHAHIPLNTRPAPGGLSRPGRLYVGHAARSEEHTSELQSHLNLVCRLLLEKKRE